MLSKQTFYMTASCRVLKTDESSLIYSHLKI